MKGFLVFVLVVAGLGVYFFTNLRDGRVGGPLSPPLGAKYREAWFGKGIVMTLANQSDQTLYNIRVKVDGKNGHTATATKDSLSPNDTTDVGWMELSNGNMEVGDTIYVYAKGYPAPFITGCNGYHN